MQAFPSFSLELIRLPLRYEWKLSRNTSVEKINGIIRAEGLGFTGMGEAAPNIRYQETAERLAEEFSLCLEMMVAQYLDGKSWPQILESLPACQALKTGLDMAFLNWQAAREGKSMHALFHLPAPRPRQICYTIPVMEPQAIGPFIRSENLLRFSWLKLKVNAESATEMLQQALLHFPGKIAIDGNEAWKDPEAVLAFATSLPAERVLFLEQPLPASMRDAYPELKARSGVEIWGDESVLDISEPDYWRSAFSGINVKLMKTGGFSRAVEMLKAARLAGLKTMIGCMVETSVGIAAAMQLESLADYMDLDGFILLEKEPYGKVREGAGSVFLTA
jgi:L-alanine-DL-glutamate epimerase-like enolase superfamily enzyme